MLKRISFRVGAERKPALTDDFKKADKKEK